MKAIAIHEFCDNVTQLQVSSLPKPQPTDDEILVKVMSVGLNFVDTLYACGKHQNNRSLVRPPFTLGSEFAGIIIFSPPGHPLQPGDRVFGAYLGSFAEYIKIPASTGLEKIPPYWSYTDAAGLGATLPVSYAALIQRGRLKKGETVLVHAAAGGLGTMAVQVAVAMGCRVIGTAGSKEKCEYAVRYGASHCFDYTKPDYWKQILDATEERGADLVYDPVGLVGVSLKCIAHRGRLLIVGFAGRGGQMESIAMNRVLLKQVELIGYRYGESLRRYPEEREAFWTELRSLIDQGKIRPTVSQRYRGLGSIPGALSDLLDRKVLGKGVVIVSEKEPTQENL